MKYRKRICNARLRNKWPRRCKRLATPGHWRCVLHGSRSTGPRPRYTMDGERISNMRLAWPGRARWQAHVRKEIEAGRLLRSPAGRPSRPGQETPLMRKRRQAMEATNAPSPEPSPAEREQAEQEAAACAAEQVRLQSAYEQAQKVKEAGIARGSRLRGPPEEGRRSGPGYATPDGLPYYSSRLRRG
jgi:hypothetical protein